MNNKKTIFTFPLINIWTIIITLIFVSMKIYNIIDWSALWILSPLWIPSFIALSIIFILYFLKFIIFIISLFYR